MTAENQGTGTPEGDDPFAYLYRQDGDPEGGQAPQPGVPRRSYNQVRAVGERQYGRQGAPSYQEGPGQDSPSAHYAAPETVPGGRAAARSQAAGDGRGRGREGRSRNGLLIGGIAVVAAVGVGIGSAMYFNDEAPDDGPKAAPTADAGQGGQQGDGPGEDDGGDKKIELPQEDASALRLDGKAAVASDISGAQARNGTYVTGMNEVGSSATWTTEVPEDGKYTVFVRYSVPGEDANSTLTVNGDPHDQPLNMKNFSKAEKGDWEKSWTNTFAWVTLKEGDNSVAISCGEGNTCDFILDRVWLKSGWVKN